MTDRDKFLEDILNKNPKYDTESIGKAYDLAAKMHAGQLRKSGDPYLVHPIEVTKILADLGMDEETLIAGLLHDVVEDTLYTTDKLTQEFGEDIAALVDGVTKLGAIVFETIEERQAENLRKMFLAMSKDIRVLIIKLADRLHNMRTIEYMSPDKIKEKSRETLDIYAPLASRLGMYNMKFEMEDTAFKYLEPEEYNNLVKKVSARKAARENIINDVIAELRRAIDSMNIDYEIKGRQKHFYSIYRKMKYQHKQLEEIFDLTAVRVIVENVKDCYAVLGLVHTKWKPIPGKFKDYIAMPKANMYQSLHTTVLAANGNPFEIQIRTYDMHKVAEYGIAAHWKYKEGVKNDTEEVKLAWLRQTLEWQKDVNDPKEFMETLKVDLFASQVFVFTPRGDVIELPAGSTPLDFAFKIHTDVGCKCVGAKVNGKMVPIDHTLNNGDIVEIMTSANASGASIDWLRIAKSSSARNKIRQWLKKENKSDSIDKGKEAVDKYLRKKGYEPHELLRNPFLTRTIKDLNMDSVDDFYRHVSPGGANLGKAATVLIRHYNEEMAAQKKENKDKNDIKNITVESKLAKRGVQNNLGVTVKGTNNLMVRMSRCCNPVPGDEIIGYTTKGRGVSVHRTDCPNIMNLTEEEKPRLIEVEWDEEQLQSVTYDTDISIVAYDRKGLFSEISKTCDEMDVDIKAVNARSSKDETIHIILTLAISGTEQMNKMLRVFKSIQGVFNVYRAV